MLAVAKDQSKNSKDLQLQICKLRLESDYWKNHYYSIDSAYRKLGGVNIQLKKQLAAINEQPETPETQKLIDHLTIENEQLKEAHEVAIEQLKAQPIMQDKLVEEKTKLEEDLSKLKEHPNSIAEMEKRIQQLQEENKQLHEELMAVSTLPKSTPEIVKQIQQLEEQKTSLEKEVEFLRQKEIHVQKEVDKTGQDGFSKDMAMVLKRYYEMEEQFGQMKKEIKQDVKNVLAKKEKKIVQQVQGHLVETEKRMQGNLVDNVKKMQEHVEKRLGETEDHFKQQAAGRVIENEKQIQQKVKESIVEHGQKIRKQLDKCLEDNEKKMQEHEKEVQQQVNQRIKENEKKMKEQTDIILASDSLMKEATHKAVDAHTIVLGETVNEQGYFTTMIPMKRLTDNMVQITGAYGGGCLYVELDKIKTYDDFKNLIKSAWGLDLKLVGNSDYLIDGWPSYSDDSWPGSYLKFKRIIIIPYYDSPDEHLINCTT